MDKHSDLIISQTDGRPLYLQIMEQIRHKIAVGDWAAGADIPSIRQLASDLCVSVITVKRAYLELEHEGLIVTQQGRGSSVSRQGGVRANLWQSELDGHLRQAARLATLLGLTDADLARQLAAAMQQGVKTDE